MNACFPAALQHYWKTDASGLYNSRTIKDVSQKQTISELTPQAFKRAHVYESSESLGYGNREGRHLSPQNGARISLMNAIPPVPVVPQGSKVSVPTSRNVPQDMWK